ncbi:MAG: cation:proton antiporter, partial [Planctomycetota bacterium]
MTVWTTLLDVVVVLLAAMVLGVVAERLRQSAIVGFMLAGVLLGPYSPLQGVVGGLGENFRLGPNNPELVGDMAQLGVTLLMFTIGLEFNWSRLKTLGSRTLVAGGLQIGLTTAAAAGAGVAFGLELKAAVAVGLALAMSSTAVVLPVLQRISEVDSVHGRFALGVLLVQDAAVVPAVLIVAALNGGGSAGEVVWGTLWSVAVVAGFVLVSWGFSKWAMPTLASLVAPSRNREMPILFAFVAAMGSAWAANELGLSAALGAFIAAVFLGESVLASQLRADLGPFKSVFVTLFFASIGMLFDPAWAWANVWVVAGATAAVVLLKPVVVAVVGLVMRLRVRHAVASGVCLCQIGVFSFVLADVARQAPSGSGAGGGSSVEMREIVSESGEPTLAEGGLRGEFAAGEEVAVSPRELPGGEAEVLPLFSDDLFNLVVAVTILALFATPYAVAYAVPAGVWVELKLRGLGLVKHSTGDREAAEPITPGH